MRELISSPGLQFELFELHGSLTYTFTRAGRPAVQNVLSELDLVDLTRDEDSEGGMPQPKKPGLDASAVGIQVRVLKNDGRLQLDFEARDGGSAKWVFDGLSDNDAKPLSVSTSTQTLPDPSLCMTCGRSSGSPAEVTDSGAQTGEKVDEDAGAPTITTEDSTSVRHRKRKTSLNTRAEQSTQKRTKREDEFALQPGHIYMGCLNFELPKGDVNTLDFNTLTGDVTFSDIYDTITGLRKKTNCINIFDDNMKFTHTSYIPSKGTLRYGPSHGFCFEKLGEGDKYKRVADFFCAAQTWRAWVVNEDGRTEDISLDDAVDAILKSVGPGTGAIVVKL